MSPRPKCHYTLPHTILPSKQTDEVRSLSKQGCTISDFVRSQFSIHSRFLLRFYTVSRQGVFAIEMGFRRASCHATCPGEDRSVVHSQLQNSIEKISLCVSAVKHFAHPCSM